MKETVTFFFQMADINLYVFYWFDPRLFFRLEESFCASPV